VKKKCVEPEIKPFNQGVYVCERLNFGLNGKGAGEMPLLPPDSGNPTVRDERGACGNVSYGGTRNPLHNRKGAGRKLST